MRCEQVEQTGNDFMLQIIRSQASDRRQRIAARFDVHLVSLRGCGSVAPGGLRPIAGPWPDWAPILSERRTAALMA